ncbi:RNB domain-containing ribonuclease [Halorutilales archaeon Cl-col2-1]
MSEVKIDEETQEKLEEKREELFEEYEIHEEFPDRALEEADEITTGFRDDIQDEAEKEYRTDLRDLTTFTVDPKRAQDFDDAISIDDEGDGEGYTLWVHIADVTHYVKPGTELYEEAKRRSTTVYLPGHTVHMLPSSLSETVCSIVGNEDRLAHTVRMEMDEDLSFDNIEIFKSVVRSDRRLTYRQAERILDEGHEAVDGVTQELGEKVDMAHDVADRLHESRKEQGSLVLNPKRDRAHTIVEECMLKANRAVTYELMWDRGVEAVYRVHPQPSEDKWAEALQEIQDLDGVSIPAEHWDEPRIAVNAAIEDADEDALRKIQRAVLKVMPRAKYMSDPFGGHYALNFDIYGHFTSPIRRIADLMNHLIVHEGEIPEDVAQMADKASERQRMAEACERDYKKYLEELGYDPHEVEEYKMED